jgi:hypothetical protein
MGIKEIRLGSQTEFGYWDVFITFYPPRPLPPEAYDYGDPPDSW